MGFKELDERVFLKPKRLPIRGKMYDFPGSVSARTGALFHRMTVAAERVKAAKAGDVPDLDDLQLDAELLNDSEEKDLRAEVLGDAEAELIKDGIPNEIVSHVLKTLICWHQFGQEVAEVVWEDNPDRPKAPQDRKPRSRSGTKASASSTRGRASTTPTSE